MTQASFTADVTPPAEPPIDPAPTPAPASAKEEAVDTIRFLALLAIAVLVFRSFFLSPFNIPSESMQPRLLIGDYLLVNKMAYGYSKYSLPFSVPLIPGRIFARTPERGDVVVFKAPPVADNDYIKRVIGLPGDSVQVKNGRVWLNGTALKREPMADFVIPVTPNMIEASRATGTLPCYSMEFEEVTAAGQRQCRYKQFRETLPSGKSYAILDITDIAEDNTPLVVVPAGHLFLMGDNRDRSADSRFPAMENQGIGLVPEENLVGHALVGMFSTDGSASWINPISWFTAARWSRIGEGFLNDKIDAGTLAEIIGCTPGDLTLYDLALTHGSTGRADYQRLEFLGDRVLGLVIASELYTRFPAASEGEMSSRLHVLASGATCAAIAQRLNLTDLVRFGAQARNDGGRYSDNIAADVIEALIGALYLDQGTDAARAFILAHWGDMIDGQAEAPKHPKAALQEWALARKRRPPEYEIVAREGPDHAPRFRVAVSIGKLARAEAEGASKQAAEKAAAAALLVELEGMKP